MKASCRRLLTMSTSCKSFSRHYSQEEQQLTIEDFKEIIRSKDEEQMVGTILQEYQYARYMERETPSTISSRSMREMLDTCNTITKRREYLRYLSIRENHERIAKLMKDLSQMTREEKLAQLPPTDPGQLFDENNQPIYKLWRNSIFMHLNDTYLKSLHDWKKQESAIFGQKLVVDLSYEEHLSRQCLKSLTLQLAGLYSLNYHSKEPFDLHFCNFDKNSVTVRILEKSIASLYHPNTMISLHPNLLTDVFPREKLVYLTACSTTPYHDYSFDDIIVLPGLRENHVKEPVALATARRYGIRDRCIPFDDHVIWKGGYSGRLALPTLVRILLRAKEDGGKWQEAITCDETIATVMKRPETIQKEEEKERSKLQGRLKTKWKKPEEKKHHFHSTR